MSRLTDPHPDFEFVDVSNLRSPSGLRAWRKAHKLTQQQLGQRLEVTWVSVNRWENGHHPIPRMVELALRYLDEHPEADNAPAAPQLDAADGLIIELLTERGTDLTDLSATLSKYRHDLVTSDLDAAVGGDKRAMIRLRKALGLRAIR